MKNKVLLNYCLLVFLAFLQVVAMAYSAGPPDGHNGQPPSGASCGLVAQCHGAAVVSNVGIEITVDGNPTQYIPGEVYNIEVFINDPFSDCFGFQFGAQFEGKIENAGEFALNSQEEGMAVSETGNFQYVEHNEPSKNGKWNFLWIAPNGNALDDVVFYAAGVAADCNGEPVNDPTYTISKKIASGCKSIKIEPVMQVNAIVPRCDYTGIMPSLAIDFEPVTGGSGAYTLITKGNSTTDKTALYEGDTFTYFYTESDVENNTIGVTVIDDEGHICKLDDDLISLLSTIPVNVFCPEISGCTSVIDIDIEPGEWNEIFNCVEGEEKLSISINNATLNGVVGRSYEVLSLNGQETLFTFSTESIEYSFGLNFTQAQIDALQVGFIIKHFNGCEKTFDFNNKIINTNISEICNSEEFCPKVISYEIDGGLETPLFKCNPTNSTNPIYTINVKNVIGGNGNYIVTAKGGALSKSNLTEGDSFLYILTKTTIEAKQALITIEDENGCISILNFNASLADYDLDALCNCFISYEYEKIQNTNKPLIKCVDEINFIYSITITNVTGVNNGFEFLTSLGEVEVVATNPEKYNIKFSKSDYDSGKLAFTIKSGDCTLTNSLPNLSEIDFSSICVPDIAEPVCNLKLELSTKTDLTCNQSTGSIMLTTNASSYQSISYSWQHNTIPIALNSNVGLNLNSGTYIIIAEDDYACKSEPLTVVIEAAKELALLLNEPYSCSIDKQFYKQVFSYNGATGDIEVSASNGIIENITSNSFTVKGIPSGDFADIAIVDAEGCSQTMRVGPYLCIQTPNINCDANAGDMLPVPFDVFCSLNAVVTLPIQFGYNTAFAYGFLVTDEDLNIVGFSDDSKIDLSGNSAGIYCIHGISYDKSSPNAPDLTATTLSQLYNQLDVCFELTEDCIAIELQAVTTNPQPPIGPKDTTFYCTGYTTPIDFCIPLSDADGGKPYLVDVISFCNPTIEGDNCVHYPPLPGLILGASETLSLIYCDDDCPQKCDTSYVNVAIREDCSGYDKPYLNDFICGLDTVEICTNPKEPIDLCVACDQNMEDYFISDVRSRAKADYVPSLTNDCFTYLPKDEVYKDIVEFDLCLWGRETCITKVFSINIVEDCDNPDGPNPNICVEQQICTLPTQLVEICLSCEANKHTDAVITEIVSLFDNCTTDEVNQMCFSYRPLPLMHLVGVDTVEVNYCTPNNECFSTNAYLTFENCEGFATEVEAEPILIENNTIVEASNDYFEINSTQETTINVLANDIGDDVSRGEVYVNIINAPQNGEINYNNTLNEISYQPNPNYTGNDLFVYEICSNGICDRAVANITVEDNSKSIETSLNISPNPVTDYINVDYTSASNQYIYIQLYNLIGQVHYSNKHLVTNNKYQNSIDLSGLERGIYLIRIIEDRKINTQKIIVQ